MQPTFAPNFKTNKLSAFGQNKDGFDYEIDDDIYQEQHENLNQKLLTSVLSRPTVIDDQLTNEDFHQGIMEKRSPSFHKRMQKRYFVLRNRMLFYYKSEEHYKENMPIKGVLNFQQVCFEA